MPTIISNSPAGRRRGRDIDSSLTGSNRLSLPAARDLLRVHHWGAIEKPHSSPRLTYLYDCHDWTLLAVGLSISLLVTDLLRSGSRIPPPRLLPPEIQARLRALGKSPWGARTDHAH